MKQIEKMIRKEILKQGYVFQNLQVTENAIIFSVTSHHDIATRYSGLIISCDDIEDTIYNIHWDIVNSLDNRTFGVDNLDSMSKDRIISEFLYGLEEFGKAIDQVSFYHKGVI